MASPARWLSAAKWTSRSITIGAKQAPHISTVVPTKSLSDWSLPRESSARPMPNRVKMAVLVKTSATRTSVVRRTQVRVGAHRYPAIRSGANATTTRIAILRSTRTNQSTIPATSMISISRIRSMLAAASPGAPAMLWNPTAIHSIASARL